MEIIQLFQKEFRTYLETFYGLLKLAPPYHSIEKAIQDLAAILKKHSPQEQLQIWKDTKSKWVLYDQAFVESGLTKKHRGIIIGLAQSGDTNKLSNEYHTFLKHFLS